MLEAALSYAARGWAVCPLKPRDKVPASAHGLKDATTDPARIREWWSRMPRANVGIATGSRSGGIIVLDFDVDDETGEDGLATLREWELANGELPETVCSETGRGGMHAIYRTDEPEGVRNSTNAAKGVDVRGEGGYIVAPPSIHPSGAAYAWENDPDEFEVAEVDEKVLDFLRFARARSTEGQRAAAAPKTSEVKKGDRNNTVYRYACSLRAKAVPEDEIRAAALRYNLDNCKPPISADEVDKAVDSALTHAPGKSAEFEATRPKKVDASWIYRQLRRHHDVCTLDGVPSLYDGERWRMGFQSIDKAVYACDERAGMSTLKDVHHRVLTLAPKRKQAEARYVAFINGVLDMDDPDSFGPRPDLVIPNVIPHVWNPDATCPELDALLDRIACHDPATRMQLEEVLGVAMARTAEFGQMAVLVNATGANGKSTYIALVLFLVGEENATSIDITDLGARFQAGELSGKLVCLSDDTASTYIDDSRVSVLKKAITGNRIHTDVKGGAGYDFTPYALIVASANEMPRIADTSGGFERRLFGIPFNAQFKRTDTDYNPHILDLVMTEEGGSRLAFLAACGLARVRANNGFTESAQSAALTAQIIVDNDTCAQFAQEEGLTTQWLTARTTAEVYEIYRDWCERAGVRPVGRRTLTSRLCRLFGAVSKARHVRREDGPDTYVQVFEVG